MPLRSFGPRFSKSNRVPKSFLEPSEMMTVFGSAIPLQARCEVWCLADDAALQRFARSNQIADNNQPRGDANTGTQRSRCLEHPSCCDQLQPGAYCTLGVVLMGLGLAKLEKYAIRSEEPTSALQQLRHLV